MLPSAGLVRRLVVCCVYIALWRVLWAFLGLSGPSVAYGPRVMLSAFCAAFKGAAGPPEYINQWRRVLGPFNGL